MAFQKKQKEVERGHGWRNNGWEISRINEGYESLDSENVTITIQDRKKKKSTIKLIRVKPQNMKDKGNILERK